MEGIPSKNIFIIQVALLLALLIVVVFTGYLGIAAHKIYLLHDELANADEIAIWENPNSGIPEEMSPRPLLVTEEYVGGFWVLGTVSAYSSEVDQTDDTPFITASGERVRDGVIANNCLVFGVSVVIGGKNYEVLDRMNTRYGCEVFDIWFASTEEAWDFGRQELEINIL